MALASPTVRAAASNAVSGQITHTNLHSATPGTTGTSELASARQATTWTSATPAAPIPSNSAALSYTIAASTTATHIGGWNALTAGTYMLGYVLSPSVTTGTSAGTVTVATGQLTHDTT